MVLFLLAGKWTNYTGLSFKAVRNYHESLLSLAVFRREIMKGCVVAWVELCMTHLCRRFQIRMIRNGPIQGPWLRNLDSALQLQLQLASSTSASTSHIVN
jgi:hypothetical protein